MSGYFITGTDTGVGKTRVAAALLRQCAATGRRVVGMKPVAAGAQWQDGQPYWEDVRALQSASSVDAPLELRNPYRFEASIAPHLAARQAGDVIQAEVIRQAFIQLTNMADLVVVEGAGGVYAPLNAQLSMIDLPRLLDVQVIMVVGLRLGCINHAVLTERALQQQGCSPVGWVASQIDPEMPNMADNLNDLRARLQTPMLGMLPWQPEPDNEQIVEDIE